jgi:hypothetical protein
MGQNTAGEDRMLTKGDEFPIHQTPEPIAFSGSDRNFYDRYFFSGYKEDGSNYFALAFGVYPHLNIMDAHFSFLGEDGVQRSLHASRLLKHERMDLEVGPIKIEVIEPLQRLKITINSKEGVSAELVCDGRAFPLQEPRFTRRVGARMLMDVTRFTQNVRWTGFVQIDNKRVFYHHQQSLGTRDRSWGIRPIGAQDPQPNVPMQLPQFYWLWAPTNFPNLSLFFHVNEDEKGQAWNTRCTLAPDGAGEAQQLHLTDPQMRVGWGKGTRRAQAAKLSVKDSRGQDHQVTWAPIATFMMKGIGYGHPEWSHGSWKGDLATEREDFKPADIDPLLAPHLHIQAICKARHEGGGLSSDGVGILEQLVIGPHAPSGFKSILDGAA